MKLRKLATKVLLGVLSVGSGAIIAACYGPIDNGGEGNRWELISGRTLLKGEGVGGLRVCARFSDLPSDCVWSAADGSYRIDVERARYDEAYNSGFGLSALDLDGPDNGGELRTDDRVVEAGLGLPLSWDITMEPAAR